MIKRLGTFENKEKFLKHLNLRNVGRRSIADVVFDDSYNIGIHTKTHRNFVSVFYVGEDEEINSIHHPTRACFYGTCVHFQKKWYLLGIYTPSLLLHILNVLSIICILNEDIFFGIVCFLVFCLIVVMQILKGEYQRLEDYLNHCVALSKNITEESTVN